MIHDVIESIVEAASTATCLKRCDKAGDVHSTRTTEQL